MVSLSGNQTQWIKTKALALKAAESYQVTIKDAKGQQVTETFSVIATTAIKYPEELQDGSLSTESRQTVQAMWLAAQKRVWWMFEAYQQTSEIADKHYPARLLRDRLEKGLRVRKPR